MNKVKTNKISKCALSLIAVATLSCSSLSFGYSIIFNAIKGNNIPKVKEILEEKDFKINEVYDGSGNSPLRFACLHNKEEIIELLLKNGANANETNKFGIPLSYSTCVAHYPATLILFIEHGAYTNEDGSNPLIFSAIEENSIPKVEAILKDKKFKINASTTHKYNHTALHLACLYNREYIVELLLKNGADANKTDKDGSTPLLFACGSNNAKIVETLLNYDAKKSINKANNNGWTPLFLTCQKYNNPKIVETLLNYGANVDQMLLSVAEGKPEILKLLNNAYNQMSLNVTRYKPKHDVIKNRDNYYRKPSPK